MREREVLKVAGAKSPDIRQVGRDLGVRYVLEGSVRKAGGQVRITGQLIDASTGAHIWAGRVDGALDDVFQLQDRVTTSVAGAIFPLVEQAEAERSRRKPTADLKAYDYYLQGMYCFYKPTTDANDEAISHFDNAMRLDPTFARPSAQAAYAISRRKSFGWSKNLDQDATEAEKLARRALDLDSQDPSVLAASGWTLAYLVGSVKEGAALLDKAIELDPNLFMGWLWRGWTGVMLTEPDTAKYLEQALRLSPLDPRVPSAQSAIAFSHFQAGRYDEAAQWATKAIPQRPSHLPGYLVAMAAHALAGRIAEARVVFAAYQKLDPTARISNMDRWLRLEPRDLEKWAEGFRLAGMPE